MCISVTPYYKLLGSVQCGFAQFWFDGVWWFPQQQSQGRPKSTLIPLPPASPPARGLPQPLLPCMLQLCVRCLMLQALCRTASQAHFPNTSHPTRHGLWDLGLQTAEAGTSLPPPIKQAERRIDRSRSKPHKCAGGHHLFGWGEQTRPVVSLVKQAKLCFPN